MFTLLSKTYFGTLIRQVLMSSVVAQGVRSVILSMCLACFAFSVAHASKLNDTSKEIKQLQKEISKNKVKLNKEEKNLKKTEVELSTLYAEIHQLEVSLDGLTKESANLQKRVGIISTALEQQLYLLNNELQKAYQMGDTSFLKKILSGDIDKKKQRNDIRMQAYYNFWLEKRAEQIAQYKESLENLAEMRQKMIEQSQVLSAKQNTLSLAQLKLKDKKQKREKAVKKMKSTVNSQEGQLKRLKEDIKALEAIVQAVKRKAELAEKKRLQRMAEDEHYQNKQAQAQQSRDSFSRRKGKMVWPVQGKQLASFGNYRPNSKIKWNGVVINANAGEAVKVVHAGEVVYADWLRGFGMLAIVQHDGGYVSLYGYNQVLTKKVGAQVKAGDTIARVGRSGGQNKPSLYFEIRKDGSPTNPNNWCD